MENLPFCSLRRNPVPEGGAQPVRSALGGRRAAVTAPAPRPAPPKRTDRLWARGVDEVEQLGGVAQVWVVGSTSVRSARILVGNIFLARLRTPRDFGLVAMALVVTDLARNPAAHGMSAALVQRATVKEKYLSTGFWFDIVLCLNVLERSRSRGVRSLSPEPGSAARRGAAWRCARVVTSRGRRFRRTRTPSRASRSRSRCCDRPAGAGAS